MCHNYDDIIPKDFICPITNEIIHEPLLSRYGQSFERNAIMKWLELHGNTCPLTGKTLEGSDLIRNRCLKDRIERWHTQRGIPFYLLEDDVDRSCTTTMIMPVTCTASEDFFTNNHNMLNRTRADIKEEYIHVDSYAKICKRQNKSKRNIFLGLAQILSATANK